MEIIKTERAVRRMKKRAMAAAAFIICCLAGCGKPVSVAIDGGQGADGFRTYFMYSVEINTQKGFYYPDQEGFMYFFDYDAEKDTIVCNKPNCKHQQWDENTPLEERCNAYVGLHSTGFISRDKLYIMENTYGNKGNHQIRIVESDLDRMNQREVTVFDSDSVFSFAVKENMLYAIVDQIEQIDHKDGTITSGSRKKAQLCSIDLSDGAIRVLMEKEDFSAVVTIMAVEDDRLYLDYSYFKKPFDGTNYKEASQVVEYYEYSTKTGELREVLKKFKEDQIIKASFANGYLFAKTAPIDRSMNEGEDINCGLVKIDLATEEVQELVRMTERGMLFPNYAIYQKDGEQGGFIYDFRKNKEVSAPKMNLEHFYPYCEAGEYVYGNLEDKKTREAHVGFYRLSDLMEGVVEYDTVD